MTMLGALVDVSEQVAATSGRLAKVRALASLLKSLEPEEIDSAVHYLSGEIRQGKIGIGYATVRAAAAQSAAESSRLTLAQVDGALGELAEIRGSGSSARRQDSLRALFAHATGPEQEFLLRLLIGELHQGALA